METRLLGEIDINYYIDEAKTKGNISSDRELSTILGYKSNTVNFFRHGRSFPSDDVIAKLADMAEMDREVALINLNIWRAPENIQKTYATILQKITQTTAIAALFLASIVPYGANAATKQEHQNYDKSRIIHYHTLLQWLISLYYSSLKNVRAFSVLHQRVTSKRLRSFGVFTYNHPLINT